MTDLTPEARQALDAAVQLATERQRAGDDKSAEALYAQVLLADPLHHLALHNLGRIRLRRGETRAALDLLEAAVQVGPRMAGYQFSLARARDAADDQQGATDAYLQALALDPDHVASLVNVGPRLHQLGRHDEAIALLRRAVALAPEMMTAWHNLGTTLQELGHLDEAGGIFQRIVEQHPLDTDAVINLAVFRLSRGDFSAWKEYGWNHWSPRWLKTDPPVLVPLPRWDGGELAGRSILLYGEQGIGDEIMFASMIPAVSARASRTLLVCEQRLVPLFARSFPGICVQRKPPGGTPVVLDAERACDLRLSLSLLPGTLRAAAGAIPSRPFLLAAPEAVAGWRERFKALGGRLTVGISWRGGHDSSTRTSRSIALERLASLFSLEDVRFVNVQYGNRAEEIAAFNARSPQPLHCFGDIDPLKDMDGLAAALAALDLVISIDNSTVHLAGALGTPTWMFCPLDANWRWRREDEASYWYDSLRLFRASALGQQAWDPVIARVADELRRFPGGAGHQLMRSGGQATVLQPLQPTVMLLNDATYWHDWSKACSSLAIHETLRAAGHAVDSVPAAILDEIVPVPVKPEAFDDGKFFQLFQSRPGNARIIERMQAVDGIVVNGTGGTGDPGRASPIWQYLAHLAATRFGKKVTTLGHDSLPLYIARHPVAARRGAGRVVVTPGDDASDAYIDLLVSIAELARTLKREFVMLTGASGFLAQGQMQVVGKLHPRLGSRYALLAATTEQQWLEAIGGADLLVAGGFQQGLAAACVGTPLLVTAGTTGDAPRWLDALELSAKEVLVSPADIAHARKRVGALLRTPAPAVAPRSAVDRLRTLAQQQYSGIAPPRR